MASTTNPSSLSLGGDHNPGRRSSYHPSPLAHSPAARQGTFNETTPERRRSLNVPVESALASSPLLKSGEQTPSRLTPTARSAQSTRSSVVSTGSLRLSRDLGHEIDWDAVSTKDEEDETSRMRARLGSESDGEGSSASNGDALTYSALSKRADFILANAKRKLNLLEGNLGRARHSLTLSPTLVTELGRSDSNASAQSAPSPTWSNNSPREDDRDRIRGPKINFGAPRQAFNRAQNGHSRGYSDSTVPTPQGNTTVGSRSYEYRRTSDWGKRHPLHKSTGDTALDSVPENPGSPTKAEQLRSRRNAAGLREGGETAGQKRVNALVEERLNAQADRIRNRISGIQQRSRDNSERRSSQIIVEDYDNLAQQYADLNEEAQADDIEAGDDENALGVDLPERGDSRLEWRQVLESGKTGPGSAGSYLEDEEDDEVDEGEEEEDYAEGEDMDDEDFAVEDPAALQGAHEDRQDAFDYEHFILHSIMGSHIDINPEDYSSSEDGSTTTERILDEELDDATEPAGEEVGPRPWTANDGSQSSFHTAHSDEADQSGSESDDGLRMGDYRDTLKKSAWPVPPSGNNGTKHVRKGSRTQEKKQRRPESLIVQQVTARAGRKGNGQEANAAIREEDGALFYAVAHSFREVCLRLQTGNLGPHDTVDLRQRLEIARRVLDGDL